jgi:hypothetical protein
MLGSQATAATLPVTRAPSPIDDIDPALMI